MKQPVFTGVCTAMVTPFYNNEINYSLMEKLIKRQIDAGVEAIVLSGTTGESPTLTDEEKTELFRRAKNYAGNNCKIIAGTGTNSTAHAVKLSIAAQRVGVDALLTVSPYYNKGNSDGIIKHYTEINNHVDIPIILYNVPSRTGIDIPVGVYKELSVLPNIIGVKEANPDITKITQIRSTCPEDFYIWSGNDDLIVPVISIGGVGIISVLSNVYPKETVTMTNAALSGDYATASALQCEFTPIISLLFRDVNPIPVKYAMKSIGYDCGDCRLPLGQLSNELKEEINNLFI